ncbi:MAG: L-2-amino-thiazoline-4-carboxylic acid hydrolase [Holophagae bacterium]|jgi:hypothetical protein
MGRNQGKIDLDRRQMIAGLCATGTLACLGCGRVARTADVVESAARGFSTASGMSFEEVFHFAYARSFIPTMKNLAGRVGMEVIQDTACETAAQVIAGVAASMPDRSLSAWAASMKEPDEVMRHAISFDIVEDGETAFEVRITECLWAATFRAADAADLGYSWVCHPDFAMARAFNPEMRLRRDQTLMQGSTHCNHRWELKSGS